MNWIYVGIAIFAVCKVIDFVVDYWIAKALRILKQLTNEVIVQEVSGEFIHPGITIEGYVTCGGCGNAVDAPHRIPPGENWQHVCPECGTEQIIACDPFRAN